jgi:hypothetical protein
MSRQAELLNVIQESLADYDYIRPHNALRKVVELHKPVRTPDGCGDQCAHCITDYPCSTIQIIEKDFE